MRKTLAVFGLALAPVLGLFLGLAISNALGATAAPTQALYGPFPYSATGLTTTVKVLKATRGNLAWYACANANGATVFIQVFDTVGTVTLGMTTPKFVIPIRVGTDQAALPVSFVTGIKLAATTTATGMSAPSTALDCAFGVS